MHRWIRASLVPSLLAFGLLAALPAAAQQPAAPAAVPRTAAPAGAKVYIISPANGAEVSSPVLVRFGLNGAGVAPAGVVNPKTGHHHLLVDGELPEMGVPFPKDATHLHYGDGQTEASITLTPGKHTLQLVLGDQNHVPHQPPIVSEKITITVK